MTARDAVKCCVHCPATAAFTALMALLNAHRSSLAMAAVDMNEAISHQTCSNTQFNMQLDDAIY
jgi:hypothetical protein